MDTLRLEMFLRELDRQCGFARLAYQDMEESRRDREHDRFWFSVQAFLVSVANLSKILWPYKTSGCSATRGNELRQVLKVRDNSPLKDKTLRNHFEHFDERLDALFETGIRGGIADGNIGIRAKIPNMRPEEFLREFQPATGTLTFQGESYHLPSVMDAVRELQAAVADSLTGSGLASLP